MPPSLKRAGDDPATSLESGTVHIDPVGVLASISKVAQSGPHTLFHAAKAVHTLELLLIFVATASMMILVSYASSPVLFKGPEFRWLRRQCAAMRFAAQESPRSRFNCSRTFYVCATSSKNFFVTSNWYCFFSMVSIPVRRLGLTVLKRNARASHSLMLRASVVGRTVVTLPSCST
jgi:hypothetical protein